MSCLAGTPVCRNSFMYLNAIKHARLKAILKQCQEDGAEPRVLKYKGRNKKAITLEDSERILVFLKQIAELHALDLPGRLPGRLDKGYRRTRLAYDQRSMIYS